MAGRWKSASTEVRTEVEVQSRKLEPAYYLVCLFLTKLPTDVIIKAPRGSVWHFNKVITLGHRNILGTKQIFLLA